ncbi:hypothetical protein QUF76_15635 [Desulfobacterales bacterium HSG16]|nr:hypothetical protein [Desulfobacterales bacterium HSG16]
MSNIRHHLRDENNLRGCDSMPAVNGGYITVYLEDVELHIASVPSFNIMAEKHRDSVVENSEEFTDKNGNEYEINIQSSNIGVYWNLKIFSKDDGNRMALIKNIKINFESNTFQETI